MKMVDVVTIMITTLLANTLVQVTLARVIHISQFSCEIPHEAKIQCIPGRINSFFPINSSEGLHF